MNNREPRREGCGLVHADRKSNLPKILLWAAVAVVAVAAILTGPVILTRSHKEAVVRIPEGATYRNVEDTLKNKFGGGYAARVVRLLKIRNFDPAKRHGAYLISKGTSPFMTMMRLTRGAQMPVRVTVNKFRDINSMAERIAAKLEAGPQSVLKAMTDPTMLASHGLTPDQALSLFLSDTYEVYWTTSPAEVVDKIGRHYDEVWNPTRRRRAAELGRTPAEVSTLASIVDEETLMDPEKGAIGRLYINRLTQGMRLQSDPTVRFAIGDFTIQRVRKEHLRADSPYNTYRYAGLPPGPICTTSVKTIDAILESDPHKYIYMCAKPDFSGYHDFASTYEEHIANALRYQHELDKRGIR